MSKKKSADSTSGPPSKEAANPPSASLEQTIRETIESVVIAFVLAFMFKTFMAEAFVIPTGSMANTLKGRHKDLVCHECGFQFQVNASSEVDSEGRLRDPNIYSVISGVCPNCRHLELLPDQTDSYNGDRILVAKFPFELFADTFQEPRRWEVVVFKFPFEAKNNYIKRLIGLPGETVQIHGGDIYISRDGKPFQLERKPPSKVLAMMQTVYDNEFHSTTLDAAGWPQRWQAEPVGDELRETAWKSDDQSKSFHTPGKSDTPLWLRYRHLVPLADAWEMAVSKQPKEKAPSPTPQLISDMYAYDTDTTSGIAHRTRSNYPEAGALGMHWVGDLIVECDLTVQQASGAAVLELVSGGRAFQCRLDLEKNTAELSIDGGQTPLDPKSGRSDSPAGRGVEDGSHDPPIAGRRVAKTSLASNRTYHVTFANVDRQLHLWIDGSLVEFDGPTTYTLPRDPIPTADDLSPAAIGSLGSGIKVSNLRLSRDIYYLATADNLTHTESYLYLDYTTGPLQDQRMFEISHGGHDGGSLKTIYDREHQLRSSFFSQPKGSIGGVDWDWSRDFANLRKTDFPLQSDPAHPELDQFFMMGDNSPASSDSRLWSRGHFVPRHLLIGKALFIYWPHSFGVIPGTKFPFPFFPNFSRMGFVR